MTFCGRRTSVEDDLRWETTFRGRRPLVEDDFRTKMTFGGGQPLVEDDLRWKMNFSGRQTLYFSVSLREPFPNREGLEKNIIISHQAPSTIEVSENRALLVISIFA